MSGTTTVSGTALATQFTGADAGSAAITAAFNALGNTPFAVFSGSGTYSGTGAVVAGAGSTITAANVVVSTTPGASLTVTSDAQVFTAAPGDTITATGSDTLFGAATGVTSFVSTGNNSSVVGGTGDLAVTASGANTTLIGGTGTNTFNITASTVPGAPILAVAGYSGTTTVSLTGGTSTTGTEIATNPLAGTTGILVATLSGAGADSVIGGGGSSTITAGGGADVFGFVDGHAGGTETIFDFNAKLDNLAFGGYGYSSTVTPAESFDASGNDVITLSDGTVITLEGVTTHLF